MDVKRALSKLGERTRRVHVHLSNFVLSPWTRSNNPNLESQFLTLDVHLPHPFIATSTSFGLLNQNTNTLIAHKYLWTIVRTMAASAADVRSILSLPSSSGGPSQPQPKKPTGPSTRKPEGISRELFALIGPSAPSIAAQLAKPRLKQKPNFGGGGKVKW